MQHAAASDDQTDSEAQSDTCDAQTCSLLAQRFLYMRTIVSAAGRGFDGLQLASARRRRIMRMLWQMRGALSIDGEPGDVEALLYLENELWLVEKLIPCPLFSITRVEAERRKKMLNELVRGRKRQQHTIGPWVLAAIERLKEGGLNEAEAITIAARKAELKPKVIARWRRELARDSQVPFEPLRDEKHLHRLSFIVQSCVADARAAGWSGAEMLDQLQKNPELVIRRSARIPIESPAP